MTDTRETPELQLLEVIRMPEGGEVRFWSGDTWFSQTGKGDLAKLSIAPYPTSGPTLDTARVEDVDPLQT